MYLFVIINYFICSPDFYLSLLVLAYIVDMQRHSKSDLSLVIQTLFIQKPNQNLKRLCLFLLLQLYALVFVSKYSRTRCVVTLRSYSLVFVNNY